MGDLDALPFSETTTLSAIIQSGIKLIYSWGFGNMVLGLW